MSAFGEAMADALREPGGGIGFDIEFHMPSIGPPSCVHAPCQDFMRVRLEESEAINRALDGVPAPRVLDVGCGVARHASHIREHRPNAIITLVDAAPDLLELAAARVPGAALAHRIEDIAVDDRSGFDLALLLGNGLGLFGDEASTRAGLRRIAGLLRPGGTVLAESGLPIPSRRGFEVAQLRFRYQRGWEGPTPWGQATYDWFRDACSREGLEADPPLRSTAPGGWVFIASAKRRVVEVGGA